MRHKTPNQSPQRNAGSRPSSDDSSASAAPSSLGRVADLKRSAKPTAPAQMRIGLLVIGVLLIVGGLGAIIKPAPYSVTARPNPAGDISFSDPKAEASTHQVNPRSVGYGAAVFGGIVILAALSLKEVSVPEPHGHPLPPSDF